MEKKIALIFGAIFLYFLLYMAFGSIINIILVLIGVAYATYKFN